MFFGRVMRCTGIIRVGAVKKLWFCLHHQLSWYYGNRKYEGLRSVSVFLSSVSGAFLVFVLIE